MDNNIFWKNFFNSDDTTNTLHQGAIYIHDLYVGFVAAGFTAEQAMELTQTILASAIQSQSE